MRLCVDARTTFARHPRGTGKNLVDLYGEIAKVRPDWRFVMFHRGRNGKNPFEGCANISDQGIDIKGDRFGLWSNLRLPLAVRAAKADLFHAPANIGPRFPGAPMVATIHDLIPLEPALATPDSARWGEAVRRTAHKASKIFTPSEYSKLKIVEFCAIAESKVVVNPWAPDRKCKRIEDAAQLAAVREKYGVACDSPYVFGFGSDMPRKNTEKVIRAWAEVPASLRDQRHLVLVGIREPALGKFRALAEALGVGESCRLHGFADEADIAALLSGAAVLVFPSLSEGFGLPLLDAFICGAAVLTSDCTSLPEVAGDAAVLVDPRRTEAIADGLRQLLSDEGLRRDLVARGFERVKAYTWEACAQRVLGVFESVAG
ncbi:glycosyltransferase family 4 protein [Geoalkalibacter sp.]|uniref:glycosyltransferase family 4 protein n=1 Tax=Geoalkalibacter sp. TaxID=3041440 RepID=UPI00272E2907|nr:glycosyltransferase family 1 protein [Geoalkalibacter sp.]